MAQPSSDATVMLVNIPAEIAHEIFSHVTDFYDLLCLSMSCQILWPWSLFPSDLPPLWFLWEIGREHLYRPIAALVAEHSWVGDRIICIGEFLESQDVPDTIVMPAERAEFFQYPTLDDFLRNCGTREMRETPPTAPSQIAELLQDRDNERGLWYYSFRRNRGRQTMFDQKALSMSCYERFKSDRRDQKFVTDLFENHEFAPLPPAVVRVLRNLSHRQYIRESALADLTAEYPKIGLGEVLLSRICLSSEDDVRNLTYDGGIHRGVWAGDRFDIVAAEWLEELGDDSSWTDISEEVVKEMGRICEVDYF
ncbi:hypothetical protein C8R47DRAFT_1206591 [Mycena vitilis]|nr:hypothetical protein C8R47DRAFT_1206591 [Mycena vitilis]